MGSKINYVQLFIKFSPRSLEACKRCGVNPNDLYFVNYETFINLHIDIKHMPRDFQELRYNYFEKIRRENVKLCTEERIKLINDHNFKMQEENHLSKSFVTYALI